MCGISHLKKKEKGKKKEAVSFKSGFALVPFLMKARKKYSLVKKAMITFTDKLGHSLSLDISSLYFMPLFSIKYLNISLERNGLSQWDVL